MIDVVIDTNVLMAALIKPGGVNAQALRRVIDPTSPYQIFYSSHMVDEYRDVLGRWPIASRGLLEPAARLINLMRRVGTQVVPKYLGHVVCPDEKDRPFIECAAYVEGIILTNNERDFAVLDLVVIGAEDFLAFDRRV